RGSRRGQPTGRGLGHRPGRERPTRRASNRLAWAEPPRLRAHGRPRGAAILTARSARPPDVLASGAVLSVGMGDRIVVFGATGYTGRLVTAELVAAGHRPVVAGRDRARVDALRARHGDLPGALADAADPDSVRRLVGPGDVLVATVGPFARFGRPAVDAAIEAGAHYLDSSGEADFLRQVYDDAGPRAERAGVVLLPASGFDCV